MSAGSARRPARHDEQILVIGLGRFGGRLARELMDLGHEVLGIDVNERVVADYAPHLTKAMVADTSDADVLVQVGAAEFNHVVVGIGLVEPSVLTVSELASMGVRDIWAKAVTEAHRRILEAVGASHVVQPEHDMGRRIAHQVTGKVLDFIQLDDDFALVESYAPKQLWARTLLEAGVRDAFGVTVVAIRPHGGQFAYATPDTRIEEGSLLLVAGDVRRVEAFAELE